MSAIIGLISALALGYALEVIFNNDNERGE